MATVVVIADAAFRALRRVAVAARSDLLRSARRESAAVGADVGAE
jgi:hypothetical protein